MVSTLALSASLGFISHISSNIITHNALENFLATQTPSLYSGIIVCSSLLPKHYCIITFAIAWCSFNSFTIYTVFRCLWDNFACFTIFFLHGLVGPMWLPSDKSFSFTSLLWRLLSVFLTYWKMFFFAFWSLSALKVLFV